MTAYFGANQTGDEEEDPWSFLDAAPAIPAPLPLTDTEIDEETASVHSAPPSTAPNKELAPPQCKPLISTQKDLLEDLCVLCEAIRVYPRNKDLLKETGILDQYLVKREHQTTYKGASVYLCPHPKCQTPTLLGSETKCDVQSFTLQTSGIGLWHALIAKRRFSGTVRVGKPMWTADIRVCLLILWIYRTRPNMLKPF